MQQTDRYRQTDRQSFGKRTAPEEKVKKEKERKRKLGLHFPSIPMIKKWIGFRKDYHSIPAWLINLSNFSPHCCVAQLQTQVVLHVYTCSTERDIATFFEQSLQNGGCISDY